MERKMMTRYLILITVLIICAGAAWYFTQKSSEPVDNAVLASFEPVIFQEEKTEEDALWRRGGISL